MIDKGGAFVGPKSSCALAARWGFPNDRLHPLDGAKFETTKFGDIEICSAPGMDPNVESSNIYIICYDGVCILHNGDAGYNGPNYLEIVSRFKGIHAGIINLGRNSRGRHRYHTPYNVARAANDLELRYPFYAPL